MSARQHCQRLRRQTSARLVGNARGRRCRAAALAITDRAGRLLCANDRFTQLFDGPRAPPDLGLDAASHEMLLRAARAAWRDGQGTIDGVKRNG